ncbi:transporter associated domain-containing protein [Natronincola ferrireducens]|uniref:Transporter associated domain-containing protein n=1 Tax=Natronincola ferrireducens TaxID=393762 RepID=A0A1G8YUJ3_9FIRM|nr:transporter associated domain-containing protein [Natronincola ferrireducens]SDK06532.1 Transporter associated domain-containing protein [Natronincola ferrireducens]
MKAHDFKKQLTKFTLNLELILAVCLAVAILIGLFDIVKYLAHIIQTDLTDTYNVFKKFLAFTLLLVVGIELVLMLLSHSTSAMLELVLFAIARKMLIYSETMLDLILGTAAIAGVFAIKKYLMTKKPLSERDGHVISAAQSVHDINFTTGLDIPENKGNTIGGLICHLSEETCTPVEEGSEYEVGNIKIRILKMKDGLIEKVILNENHIREVEERI